MHSKELTKLLDHKEEKIVHYSNDKIVSIPKKKKQ
jgi:hypothetical protein